MNRTIAVIVATLALMAPSVTSAAEVDPIGCGNAAYRDAMDDKDVLLKGRGVQCWDHPIRTAKFGNKWRRVAGVTNYKQTGCLRWAQNIAHWKTNVSYATGRVTSREFYHFNMLVWDTCRNRLWAVIVPWSRRNK